MGTLSQDAEGTVSRVLLKSTCDMSRLVPHLCLGAAYPHWRPNFYFLVFASVDAQSSLSTLRPVFTVCLSNVQDIHWVLTVSVCHFPHPNLGMQTAHGLKLVHRPVLFYMWNSTVLLKFSP